MLHITPDERDTLWLLANGATRARIAGHLGTSVPEVDLLVRALCVRMGAASETDAVAAARRRGLLDGGFAAAMSSR
jgi:DNA-binding CsgD family transcriptional regulator